MGALLDLWGVATYGVVRREHLQLGSEAQKFTHAAIRAVAVAGAGGWCVCASWRRLPARTDR
eukprot:scaffold27223_cov101-Isochrysis_galbana.AAC.2